MAADLDPDATLVEDLDDLVAEVVDDLYVRRFALSETRPARPRRGGRDRPRGGREPAARRSWSQRGERAADARAALAEAVRGELERRKRRARRPHLRRPARAPRRRARRATTGRRPSPGCARATASCSSTSSRTPTRCSGRSCARRSAAATLVLIGDPKQAIYAFRGADVYTYLEAARHRRRPRDAGRQLAQRPGAHRRLRRAVRRHAAGARGDRLPPGARRAARAAARRAVRRCASASSTATTPTSPSRRRAAPSSPTAREHVAKDLAADLVRVLDARRGRAR